MKSMLRRYFYFLIAAITYLIIHEGVHIVQAYIYAIYEGIRILPIGIEILITQPLKIEGLKLALFSGLSSVVTIIIGYVLLFFSSSIINLSKQKIKNYLYYTTLIFLLLDPLYISLLSFFTGGDINGIVLGLNTSYTIVRVVYSLIFIVNIILAYRKLYPAYVIKND